MKKILLSLSAIVFVGAAAVGATGAFFNDVETSTGNTFTAGAIDLTVDSEQHYNNAICVLNTSTEQNPTDYWWQLDGNAVLTVPQYPVIGSACTGTWSATDLGAQQFWNFGDVKPGDNGENTISLHITSNPAWACIDVNLTKNDDVSSNEPELSAGDVPEAASLFDGELAQNLNFAAWLDQGNTPGWQGKFVAGDPSTGDVGEGDNIWGGSQTEPLLFSNQSGPASDVLGGKSYPLAMPGLNGGAQMTPNQTNYIGLAWCAGAQAIVGSTITCNGAALGNIVQTDSVEASVAFRVEQARNNPNFTCAPRPQPET